MSGRVSHDVLRRMVSPPPPAPEDVPITSSRAMRMALTRAADKTHNLIVTVTGLREEVLSLDKMLASLDPDLMLVAMSDGDAIGGLAGLDLNMRSALIEVQTVGKVLAIAPDPRPATGTDASMSQDLLNALLRHMGDTTPRTPLDGWGQGLSVGDKVADARAAGLILPERSYRVVRMSVDLAVADRVGELVLALPMSNMPSPVIAPKAAPADWSTQLQATVNASHVRLDAHLTTVRIPLYVAENLRVGQTLPLPGCTVSSVRLLAHDGRRVATARLGQSGGMRAVRIEQAARATMDEITTLGAAPTLGAMPGSVPLSGDIAAPEMGMPDMDLDGFSSDTADDSMADPEQMDLSSEFGGTDDMTGEMGVNSSGADSDVEEGWSLDPSPDEAADVEFDAAAPLDWSNEDL